MENKTILQYLQDNHTTIHASCNGNHQCGKCKVKVLNRKIELKEEEKKFLSCKEIEDGIRLACFHQYHESDEVITLNHNMEILDDLDEITNSQYSGIGLIIDIGTTTIVMKWIDRSTGHTVDTVSFVNPQVTFGGDVISRIHYYNQNKNDVLHHILVDAIEKELINKDLKVNQMIICGIPQ